MVFSVLMRCLQELQSEEAVVEAIGRDQCTDHDNREDELLDIGEDGLTHFMFRFGEEDYAGRIQQRRQQQVLQATCVDQPHRVENRDTGDDQVFAAIGRVVFVGLALDCQQQAIGCGPEVRDEDHRGRQQQHLGVRVHAVRVTGGEEGDHQEDLYADVGQPEGIGRHLVGVLLAEELRHGVVLGGGEHDLGAQQDPGEQGTEQGDQQTDADQHRAPVTDHMLQHQRHRRVLQLGQFRLGHHAHGQDVHQHQQQQDGNEADHGGLADVRAFFRTGGEDAGALDADEHPHGDQHHVAHLVHHAAQVRVALAPDVCGEDVQLEGEQADQDEQEQRDDLRHRGDGVDERRFLDPAQHQEVQGPQQDRRADDGGDGVALAEDREEVAQGAEQQKEVADVAEPGADPVTPGR